MDFIEMFYEDEEIDFSSKKGVWRKAIRIAGKRYGITSDPKTHDPEYRAMRQREYFDEDGEDEVETEGMSAEEVAAAYVNGELGGADAEDIPEDVPHPDVNPEHCPTPLDAIKVIDEMAEDGASFVRSADGKEPNPKKVDERERTAVDIVNNDIQPFDGGEYEHFTKQTSVDFNDISMVYADMQQQENDSSLGLTMHVLYDLFYEKAKTIDVPSIIFMDEFHYMLRDSLAQQSLNMKIRHGRHWDLSHGVSTQSFKDFFGTDEDGNVHLTDNAQVLFENMPTQIFHQENITEEWLDELELSSDEADFIRNAEPGNAELGFSTALLRVRGQGTYPMKVKMDRRENPRESIFTDYDPSKHDEDMLEYLLDQDDVAEWRFAPSHEDIPTPVTASSESTSTGGR